MSPIRYAAWILAIYVVATRVFGVDLVTITSNAAESTEEEVCVVSMLREAVRGVWAFAVLLSLPVVALARRGLFRRSGHNYAEGLAFSLFAAGPMFLVALVTMPLQLFESKAVSLVPFLVLLTWFTWAARTFFRDAVWLTVLKSLALAVVLMFTMVPLLILGVWQTLGEVGGQAKEGDGPAVEAPAEGSDEESP